MREVINRVDEMSVGRLFLRYAVPSVITMMFFGIQSLIDGVVVGNYIGEDALAGVNIILPLYSGFTVFAITVGVGCQTLVSQGKGGGNRKQWEDAFVTGLLALSVVSVGSMVAIVCNIDQIVRLLGADQTIFSSAKDYLMGLVYFIPSICLCMYFDFMLKGIGKPIASTAIMVAGVVINIILSFFFVMSLKMGMAGASIATGISFSIALLFNSWLVVGKKDGISILRGKFDYKILSRAVYNGSSEGMSEMSSAVCVLIVNKVIIAFMGAKGVSAYTILGYVDYIGILMFLGISDGLIPVMSYTFGKGNFKRLKEIFSFACYVNVAVGILVFVFLQFFGVEVIRLFLAEQSQAVEEIASRGLEIFSYIFLFSGLSILITSFFTSIGYALSSIVLSVLRGLVFIALTMPPMIKAFGEKGIWLSIVVSEVLTLVIAIVLVGKTFRKMGKE